MSQIALVTGASSGFGRMIATALAENGHTVYASMRDLQGRNAAPAAELAAYAAQNSIALRTVELDVQDDASAEQAVGRIIRDEGRLDVVVHNAGHMVYGPTEAFTPSQLAALYDVNVLGTQRVNRAALPQMRRQGRGLLVWIGSTSAAGGIPPLLGPYFAAKAGMDALAVSYARELAPLGIETSIVVPGAFTQGTNHFAHAGAPDDGERADAYAAAWPDGFAVRLRDALAATVPPTANPRTVAEAVARIVDTPFGSRPFRIVIDPADDGAATSYAVIDRIRQEFLHRIGFAELLRPHGAP
ncbi:SDR family oxidoreductase [Azospirillum sp. TSO35-2]|uniref:SDR family oxidoreductase n=1 Tax=Azospirillum sp. TSO35-2 TaxID=716796 RepID=UPI000D6185A4|nr:SDR family oxidoreductase [Azospirillum sp. TSO35-2]PWC32834.1 oxidoreductase [Azospirillum sp. TSO35-2]